MYFGPHLMLDFFCSPEHLNDKPYWEQLLKDLVVEVGMTPISPPFVYTSVCTNPAWNPPTASGLSGFIVLAESHLAFHSFVEAEYCFLDVFSCKHFEEAKVIEFLIKRLGAYNWQSNKVERGANFPRSEKN